MAVKAETRNVISMKRCVTGRYHKKSINLDVDFVGGFKADKGFIVLKVDYSHNIVSVRQAMIKALKLAVEECSKQIM